MGLIPRGSDNFKWDGERDCIIAKSQLAVAVYENANGEIVLRQEDDGFDDGDTLIALTPRNAGAVGHALICLAHEMGAYDDPAPPPSHDTRPDPEYANQPEGEPGPLLKAMEAGE